MPTNDPRTGLAELTDLAGRTLQARSDLDVLEKDRDQQIVALLVAGFSTREVAAAAGVTQARVVQIHTKARNAANHPVVDGTKGA